jgi:hypothetical protein
MKMARTLNIPVWSDYDDWLFHLPPWNPHADSYHTAQIQSIMACMIACSDVVTVSTSELQKKFSLINSNVVIVPNAYRSDLFQSNQKKRKVSSREDLYFWRGTNTHDGDLISVLDGFRSLSHPVRFMGSPSYSVISQMDPKLVQKQNHIGTLIYWKMLEQINAKILLFPLQDCFFNLCKSNIAWIEAIHAGSVVVAPDFPEWNNPGVITYTPGDSQSFLAAAEQGMALSSEKVLEINQEAYEYMTKLYDISVINRIRVQIVKTLTSPDFRKNPRDPFMADVIGLWALSILKGEDLPKGPIPTPKITE